MQPYLYRVQELRGGSVILDTKGGATSAGGIGGRKVDQAIHVSGNLYCARPKLNGCIELLYSFRIELAEKPTLRESLVVGKHNGVLRD